MNNTKCIDKYSNIKRKYVNSQEFYIDYLYFLVLSEFFLIILSNDLKNNNKQTYIRFTVGE